MRGGGVRLPRGKKVPVVVVDEGCDVSLRQDGRGLPREARGRTGGRGNKQIILSLVSVFFSVCLLPVHH